jgi:hypothetical protein
MKIKIHKVAMQIKTKTEDKILFYEKNPSFIIILPLFLLLTRTVIKLNKLINFNKLGNCFFLI